MVTSPLAITSLPPPLSPLVTNLSDPFPPVTSFLNVLFACYPGWEVGVATMKLHEVCELKIAAEYAYGDKGFPPKIQPGATLVFEVELVKWDDEDITEEKDGGVLKRTLQEGFKG